MPGSLEVYMLQSVQKKHSLPAAECRQMFEVLELLTASNLLPNPLGSSTSIILVKGFVGFVLCMPCSVPLQSHCVQQACTMMLLMVM